MTGYRHNKLYRNTRDAKIMGVCAGVADYLDVRVCFVRFLTIIGILMSAGWGIALYLVLGFVLDTKPDHLYERDDERQARRHEAQADRNVRKGFRERRRERRTERRERKAENRGRKYWQKENPAWPEYDTKHLRRRFADIEKRMQGMEAYMTSKRFRLDRELRGLED